MKRGLLAMSVSASLATACTAYVAVTLNGLDNYAQSNAPGGPNDPCALVSAPDAANDCSRCIAKSCAPEVSFACNGGNPPKGWFSKLQACAQNPYDGTGDFSYKCYPYDEPDAQPITGTDDTAQERTSELCVRDNCLDGGNRAPAACHECIVSVQKAGTSGDTAFLTDSPCGQCLAQACLVPIARCCGYSLPDGLAKCGYPNDPTFKAACQSLGTPQDGGVPGTACTSDNQCLSQVCNFGSADAGCGPLNSDQQCDFDIRTCFKQCAAQCM